jgi:hypothetical protein
VIRALIAKARTLMHRWRVQRAMRWALDHHAETFRKLAAYDAGTLTPSERARLDAIRARGYRDVVPHDDVWRELNESSWQQKAFDRARKSADEESDLEIDAMIHRAEEGDGDPPFPPMPYNPRRGP